MKQLRLAVALAVALVAQTAWTGQHPTPLHKNTIDHHKTAKTAQKKPVKPLAKATKNAKTIAGLKAQGKAQKVVAPAPIAEIIDPNSTPPLRSSAFLVTDQTTGEILLEKNSSQVVPIASITKLMTAMVTLDARLDMNDKLRVNEQDIDTLRGSHSCLAVGSELSREDMLRLALMASENRAASSLARNYPGGFESFVHAMNRKAQSLGLKDTRFFDSTGLNARNVSSARDLTLMVSAASRYPQIRDYSTTSEYEVFVNGRPQRFGNTNGLVRSADWQIGVSKTGYIHESGKCLVMQAWVLDKPTIIVLLDSLGRYTRVADAIRVKRWLEATHTSQAKMVRKAGGPATS